MKHCIRHAQKGSLVLVVLCFLAVLGLGLAGYLTVSSQSMRLSNRSYVNAVGRQLAEAGLEQALSAFSRNDWSGWTITGTTANRTINFPATKYGSSGLISAINLRVDNYNAYNLSATWNSTTTYQINDLIGYNGVWYRCVKNGNLNNDPSTQTDLSWWAPAPMSWQWSSNITYSLYDVVSYNGVWYRYSYGSGSTSGYLPTNATYWTSIPVTSLAWNSVTTYSPGHFVRSGGTWYRAVNTNTNSAPPNVNWSTNISWTWGNAVAYEFNDQVYSGGIWYRCILAHTNHAPPNATYWENALSGSWAWASTDDYNLNDVIYYSGSWYRCILAHTTSHTPPNATYWSNAPLLSTAWDPGKQYAAQDTVTFNGVWYRARAANNGQTPPTLTPYFDTYWASTADTTRQWDPGTAYSVGNHCSYGGVWYSCVAANTNKSPNNATYWSAMGAPVVYAEGAVTLPDGSKTKPQFRATIGPASLFPNAIGAATTLTVSGGGTVDSYDGSVYAITPGGSYSTYAYNQSTAPFTAGSPNLGYSAVLAAGNTTGTAVTLGSTAVKGYVAAPSSTSSPYAPLFSSGGSVKGPASPGSPNIDLTRISRSPYIPQFDPLPLGGLAANWATVSKGTALPSGATLTVGTPGATTPSRYYYNGNLVMGGGSSYITTLNIVGPTVLYINGNLVMVGLPNGIINISSTGSAEIHLAGGLEVDAASDGTINNTGDPKKLIFISDVSSTTSQYYNEGVNPLRGVVYAPYTTNSTGLKFDNTATIVYGAAVAKKIYYTANATVHYDTSLRYATFGGIDQPYAITEWRELTDATERITLP